MNSSTRLIPTPGRLVLWRSHWRRILPVLVGLVALLLLAGPALAVTENGPAPEITLTSVDGSESLLSDYQGQFVLVSFWATWCGPCKMEMPSLELLYQKFKNRNFKVIGISNDMFGERVVKPFVKAHHLNFPMFLDPKLTASKRFGVTHLPTTFLISPDGKVIGRHEGGPDWFEPNTVAYFDHLLSSK